MCSRGTSDQAGLRNVQDVARVRSGKTRQKCAYVTDSNVRGRGDNDQDWLCSSGAAPACHAGGRARAVVAAGQLVAGTRLVNDEAGHARGAERQQSDDDGKGEPPHQIILCHSTDAAWFPPVSTRIQGHWFSRPVPARHRLWTRRTEACGVRFCRYGPFGAKPMITSAPATARRHR